MPEKKLIAQFEVVDSEEPEYVFDERSRIFLTKNAKGVWVGLKEPSLRRQLKRQGKRAYKLDGETLTEIDQIINETELEHRVTYAGPLAGHWSGFKTICDNPVLVTEDPHLVEPVKPDDDAGVLPDGELLLGKYDCRGWPVLGQVVKNMLSSESVGDVQLERYFGYVAHVLNCLYDRKLSKIIALLIAGEAECGKTLLFNDIHRVLFGGRIGKPYTWMIGRDNFNAELLSSVLQTVDDEVNNTHMDARNMLGEKLKQIVANSEIRIRGMQKEGFNINPLWAPCVMVNLEPANLLIFPPIEEDNKDKFLIMKAFKTQLPMPVVTIEERDHFWAALMSELPKFVWWIRNEWTTPRDIQGRFGVSYWHHPEIVDQLMKLSPAWILWGHIKRTFFKDTALHQNPITKEMFDGNEWMGTIEDLRSYLIETKKEEGGRPCLTLDEARKVPETQWLGRRLKKLEAQFPECVRQERTDKTRYWHLTAPNNEET